MVMLARRRADDMAAAQHTGLPDVHPDVLTHKGGRAAGGVNVRGTTRATCIGAVGCMILAFFPAQSVALCAVLTGTAL
jgi:hypothetical protein